MTDSILTSIKILLGIIDTDTSFDVEVSMMINSALMGLNLLGVGPSEGFVIEDSSKTWTQFLGSTNALLLSSAKTYTYMRAKLIFDPPPNSYTVSSMEKEITRQGWEVKELAEN